MPLWIIVITLCVISILVVYSSTASMAYREMGGDTSHYVLRQLKFIIPGFFITIIVHFIEPKFYLRWSRSLFILSVIVALLTFIPLFGVTINGAARWFRVPFINLTFLPSDVLKLTLVMYLAVKLGTRQGVINKVPLLPSFTRWNSNPKKNRDIYHFMTKPLVLPIVISAAVIMPANLSTALIVLFIGVIMLLMGRVRRGEIVRLVWLSFVALVLSITLMSLMGIGRVQTWVNRIESYVSPIFGVEDSEDRTPEDEFQKTQARIAIASGGILGKGPGNSTQRSQLPHPYSDFAYAFIIEEYGLLGGIFILLLYLWTLYRAGLIMRQCYSPTHSLLVGGLSLVIVTPAFVNMLVSVGIVPVTGQSLPLISLGGTSVLFTSISFGVILGVARSNFNESERRRRVAALAQKEAQDGEGTTAQEEFASPPSDYGVEPSVGRKEPYDSQRSQRGVESRDESKTEDFVVTTRGEGYAPRKDGEQRREVFNLED